MSPLAMQLRVMAAGPAGSTKLLGHLVAHAHAEIELLSLMPTT